MRRPAAATASIAPADGGIGVLSFAVVVLVATYVTGSHALAVACGVPRRRRHRTRGAP